MARPKEFERDAALTSAKMVFWKKGYSATTTDDLRLAMGIGRQSFYDTFKSKHDLFIEVLNQYVAERRSLLLDTVKKNHTSPLSTLEAILNLIANEDPSTRTLGCIGISSICEFGTTDTDIHETNVRAGNVWIQTFEDLLTEAKAANEVRKDLDPKSAALFLNTLLAGVRVASRGGMKPKELKEISRVAIEGLKK